ncbi:MAG: hypothetical protein RQ723_03495 [Desulfuromonadales bacterium]|nr:hypothetical protein [Desulfuromonadales bacterium]
MATTPPQRLQKTNPEHFKKVLSARLDAIKRGAGGHSHQGSEMLRLRFSFDRLRTDTHLVCIKCKKAITEKRLLANPTVLTCGTCEPDREATTRR